MHPLLTQVVAQQQIEELHARAAMRRLWSRNFRGYESLPVELLVATPAGSDSVRPNVDHVSLPRWGPPRTPTQVRSLARR